MHVSFRNRLTFFFILLVILPVLAVAAVGILIVRDSEEAKNDATLEQAQRRGRGPVPRRARPRAGGRADGQHGRPARDRRPRRRPRGAAGPAGGPRRRAAARSGCGSRSTARSRSRPGAARRSRPPAARVVDADGRSRGRHGPVRDDGRVFADLLARVTGLDVRAHAGRAQHRGHRGGRHPAPTSRSSGETRSTARTTAPRASRRAGFDRAARSASTC